MDSVVAQDYPNVEYVIIDGVSKDSTLDIVRSYGDQVAILLSLIHI